MVYYIFEIWFLMPFHRNCTVLEKKLIETLFARSIGMLTYDWRKGANSYIKSAELVQILIYLRLVVVFYRQFCWALTGDTALAFLTNFIGSTFYLNYCFLNCYINETTDHSILVGTSCIKIACLCLPVSDILIL